MGKLNIFGHLNKIKKQKSLTSTQSTSNIKEQESQRKELEKIDSDFTETLQTVATSTTEDLIRHKQQYDELLRNIERYPQPEGSTYQEKTTTIDEMDDIFRRTKQESEIIKNQQKNYGFSFNKNKTEMEDDIEAMMRRLDEELSENKGKSR